MNSARNVQYFLQRGTIAAGLLALTLGASPSPATAPQSPLQSGDSAAAGGQPIRLVYSFYGAGFHLATLETNARLAPGSYEISTKAESSGLADTLIRARLESSATGTLSDRGPVPARFQTYSDSRFGERELSMQRRDDGTFDVAAEPELEPQQSAALRSGLADGTLDPLTASIYSVLRPRDTACTEDVRVFDGRRVFKLAFDRQGTEDLAASTQAAFNGQAVKCHLEYVPLAGQSREWKLEQARDPSPPIVLWLAPFEAPGNQGPMLLPVRVELDSPWGMALAHLEMAEIGGKPVLGTPTTTAP